MYISETGSVINAGTIIGTNSDGVYMNVYGSVNNLTGGTITGGADGVEISRRRLRDQCQLDHRHQPAMVFTCMLAAA